MEQKISIEYFNIESHIQLSENVQYKNFSLNRSPEASEMSLLKSKLHSIKVEIKLTADKIKTLDYLYKKKTTDRAFCVHFLVMSELNVLLYKIATAFSAPIHLNYPIFLKFDSDEYLYKIETPSDAVLIKLKTKIYNYKEDEVYRYMGVVKLGTDILNNLSIKRINKVKNKYTHLSYLYFTALNQQQDKYFRLLSAWKYLEEYIEHKGLIRFQQNKIPKIIFDDIFKVKYLFKRQILGTNSKSKKYWVHDEKFSKQYLKDFYNEVRNLIAHHKRDSHTYISEKKYTPFSNINSELRMERALGGIITFLSILNNEYFGFSNFNKDIKIEKITRKYYKFPKRL